MDTSVHMNRTLAVNFGTSRGQDTYGYSIVTLTDGLTGEKCRAIGGGYDLIGTVFGEWLQHCLKTNTFLRQAFAKGVAQELKKYPDDRLYGLNMKTRKGKDGWVKAKLNREILNGDFHLDGGCGCNLMEQFAKMCGLNVKSLYIRAETRRGTDKFIGWDITVDPKGIYAKVCQKAGQNLYLD